MLVIKVNHQRKTFTIKRIQRTVTVNRVGRRGLTGQAATIAVGSTSTLPAGSSATVNNTGTSNAAVLNFGIPQGEKGEPGDPASNIVTSVNEQVGDVVLEASDVGADALGSASNALSQANTYTDEQIGDLATVASTGSYNDLLNKPTIPSTANLFNKTVDDSDDITQGATNLFLTAGERTKLANTSGTNTGDQNLAPYATIVNVNAALSGKEDLVNKSNSTTLGTSSTLYPTQNAVKVYSDGLISAHLAATDPHPQYINEARGDARYAGQPYAVMAKAKFASLASSYGMLGKIFLNNGYVNDLQVYGESTQASVPTPDVPVPIVSTTGNVTVRSDSRNLAAINKPLTPFLASGITYTPQADGSILMNGTSTANYAYVLDTTNSIRLNAGVAYTVSNLPVATSATTIYVEVITNNDDGTTTFADNSGGGAFVRTPAKSGNARYTIVTKTGFVASNLVIRPQLEIGSVATAFEKNTTSTQTLPLSTTQLRSLPNGVSDRIYKSGSSWFLERSVGVHTFLGSDVGVGPTTRPNGGTQFVLGVPGTAASTPNDTISVYSDRFVATTFNNRDTVNNTIYGWVSDNAIRINTTIATTTAAMSAWFIANPTTVHYSLITPTTTTITDPTLITALENIRTYQGITNITASTPVSGSYGLDLTASLAGKANVADTVTLTGTQTLTNKTILAPIVTNMQSSANLNSDVGTPARYYSNLFARRHYFNSTAYIDGATAGRMQATGLFMPVQAATAPAYVKGAIYFDTTLNKLRVGGATAWETITSA